MKIKELELDLYEKEGIYFSEKINTISYPKEGNKLCYQLEDESYWFQHRNKCIIEAIKLCGIKNSFFDIGGGNGFVSRAIMNENIEPILIEPGLEGCLNAKKRGVQNIICSTLQNSTLPKNSINAAGLFDVIEHIEDDKQFLKTLHAYIQDEGYVLITVPSFNLLWSKDDNDAGHYRRYTKISLSKTLNECGYKIIFSTYLFTLFPIPILLFRSIPSILFKQKKKPTNHVNQHKIKNKNIRNFLNYIFDFELKSISKRKSLAFGSSCFVIAQKLK